MDTSICNFLPQKNYTGDIKLAHFVYEAEHASLKQPFLRAIYYCYLVTGGTGKISVLGKEYPLCVGSIFFGFPGVPAEVLGDDAFRYMYISFMGSGADSLLSTLGIDFRNPVYNGFENIIEHWFSAISRVNPVNAHILAESVFFHTLSYIQNSQVCSGIQEKRENICEMMEDYVRNHFTSTELTLTKMAVIFNYTDKYISYLFKHHVKVGFNSYLNLLRIEHAKKLIAHDITSIRQLAAMCGYNDALYFSKVFKKLVGMSPSEYIKQDKHSERTAPAVPSNPCR